MVDGLLEAWLASDHRPVPEIKIVGHRWSARSSEVREFLARNQVPYRWYSSDEPEGERLLRAAGIETTDGDGLQASGRDHPGRRGAGGARRRRAGQPGGAGHHAAKDFYDLIVIGGGPAGLGAAVYGASEGLRTVLVERTATGGQAGQSSRIENYLGFPDGVSGAQLTERARRQAAKFGAEVLTTRDVVGLEINGSARSVRFADGTGIDAHTVILATGVSYRRLAAPGLDEMTGRGVYYGIRAHRGRRVLRAGRVHRRRRELRRSGRRLPVARRQVGDDPGPRAVAGASMSYYLVQQIRNIPNISVRTCTEVIGAQGYEHLESLTLRDTSTGASETVDAQWLFLFIGAAPLTDWLKGLVECDERGFVVAGPDLSVEGEKPRGWTLDRSPYHLETSVPGVFVAGDARSESAKRVASAVGEGAMAVMLVHRYLEKL